MSKYPTPWRFRREDNIIRFLMRRNGRQVLFIYTDELRAFADQLHDLADDIEQEGTK